MGKHVKRSMLLILSLLIMAVFGGMTVFAYTAVDDDGDRGNYDDTSMHTVYSTMGMLRIVDDGTSVTLSEDLKTVHVSATTSESSTWNNITKLALTEEEASLEDKEAAANDIIFGETAVNGNKAIRHISFDIPVADIGKKIPVCRYQSDEWKPFSSQAYFIILMTDNLYNQISEAYETATDSEVKTGLETAMSNVELIPDAANSYMFSPSKVALVDNGNNWILKIIYGKDTYKKAFLGWISEANEDDSAAISFEGEDGKINIPISALNTDIPVAFKGSRGYTADRMVNVNKAAKSVSFKGFTKAQQDAITSLEETIKTDNYSGDEKTAIEKILEDAKTAINAAKTFDEIDTAKAEANTAASKIKTNSVKAAEKAAAEKAAADKAAAAKAAAEKAAAEKAAITAAQKVKAAIKAPKAAKKAITVNWTAVKKSKKITGYQVNYALNKKFTKSAKNKLVKGYSKKSLKVKKLKAKKTYYVRVRTYTKISGKTYYGKWSAVKKVKTK
ncbi:MAG: DUF1542 domain-containing protein [Eubacterium sp.]|nr:DUF1542 domain-containing protein [Eubacterium sp.]